MRAGVVSAIVAPSAGVPSATDGQFPIDGEAETEADTDAEIDGEADTEEDLDADTEALPIKYLGIGIPCFSNHQQK